MAEQGKPQRRRAAFVTLKAGESPSAELSDAIEQQVADVIGKIAFTDGLPKTPSGKIMRRLLKEILEKGDVQSDTTALEDRSSIEKLKATVRASV